MVAKQGTAKVNIRLDHENAEYIEGKLMDNYCYYYANKKT
jgi:hypothetical protein